MKILGGPQRQVQMVNINAKTEAEDSGSSCLTVHDSKQCEGSKEEGEQQLLPGILNEITINQIAPKLPWTAFYILSSVSRGWQQAIQSHQIYEARVRCQSTQTLVVLHHRYVGDNSISVCSSEDGLCWHLPPIPGFRFGFPTFVQCISLDCKVYIIGALKEHILTPNQDGPEVYVFDLAGQRQWKQVASMRNWRSSFGCGVMDGKIYVFGGTSDFVAICESEVYDPEENTWSPVAPMISLRAFHNVTAVGEELFVHSGQVFHLDLSERIDPVSGKLILEDFSADVYHTVKDEWRSVEHFTEPNLNFMVTMRGKLRKVTERGIDVYDTEANSWEPLHPFSWTDSFSICGPYAAVPVDNDELLLVVGWQNRTARHRAHEPSSGTCLLRSQGCGDKSKEVVWQKIECSFPFDGMSSPCLCPLQI